MADLHPEVLKMIEAGPQEIDAKDYRCGAETPEEFARRIAALAVEKERKAEQESILNVLRGIDGRVPTASEWKMICGVARELEEAIRRMGKP